MRAEFFDIFGFIGFLILFIIALKMIKTKKRLPKLLEYIVLIIGIISLIVGGYLVISTFILKYSERRKSFPIYSTTKRGNINVVEYRVK